MTAAARLHMIDSQIRPNDVTDPQLLAAIGAVARENFVPRAARALAYADIPVEIAPGRALLEPRCFAKLLQLARITATDRILDVACGTGYSSAVLARLGGHVVALEQDADLMRIASDALSTTANITLVQGGLIEGAKMEGPFDVIIVEGMIEQTPDTLLSQLAEGGRLVTILSDNGQGRATLFVKDNGGIGHRAAFDAAAPMLAGFKKAVGFVF
jgi:protein-L-isoaspartate(D-aspartate) O-methyltransferase